MSHRWQCGAHSPTIMSMPHCMTFPIPYQYLIRHVGVEREHLLSNVCDVNACISPVMVSDMWKSESPSAICDNMYTVHGISSQVAECACME